MSGRSLEPERPLALTLAASLASLIPLFLLAPTVAAQQADVVLEGRVSEIESGVPIAGATVVVDSAGITVTDGAGVFRLDHVPPGRRDVRVEAIGYASWAGSLLLRGDTVLQIRLQRAPVPLDTLRVRSRTIGIRGRVTAAATGRDLRGVEVRAGAETTRTNGAGRFRLRRVPAGGPVDVQLRLFGYLPGGVTIDAERDTSIALELRVDSVARRMVAAQVRRLEQRSHPYASTLMKPIDRAELERKENHSLYDLLREEYGPWIERVQCILIDDEQRYEGFDLLKLYAASDLQRVEVLFGGHMLRIYTRDYVIDMIAGRARLVRPLYLDQVRPPLCR